MTMMERIHDIGLVPVVVFKTLEEVVPTMDALIAGDVPVAEICFRTDCAEEGIRIAAARYPDALIGAGTVINADQCERAIAAGAKFIVSPGISEKVNEVCVKHGVPYLPGVVTPTEVMMAIDMGIKVVKFFPAGVFGGLKAISALAAAFPQLKFMPTGGVDNSNLAEFVKNPKIYACGGSFMCKGTPEEITASCLKGRSIIKENR